MNDYCIHKGKLLGLCLPIFDVSGTSVCMYVCLYVCMYVEPSIYTIMPRSWPSHEHAPLLQIAQKTMSHRWIRWRLGSQRHCLADRKTTAKWQSWGAGLLHRMR